MSNSAKNELVLSGGTTARDSLTTRDSPRNAESVPSVMMITGMPQPDREQAVDEAEQAAEGDADPGREPRVDAGDMALAAMTAEKLNIQPTDRSMSRMASRKTMASASIPMKAAPDSCWNRVAGRKKFGRSDADDDDERDQRDEDAGLVREAAACGACADGAGVSPTGSGSVADVPAVTCLLGFARDAGPRGSSGFPCDRYNVTLEAGDRTIPETFPVSRGYGMRTTR